MAKPQIEVSGVGITHPDRVMYPGTRLTKGALALYYAAIADHMLPHVEDRPLTLVRCPTGIGAECFYMKHSKVWAPPAVRRVRLREKLKIGEYLVVDTAAALVSLVQMDVLEVHTWNARCRDLEHPDRIVLDIDPGPQVSWGAVVAAARDLRRMLHALELETFVKTTGGRGLHVVVPLRPHLDWSLLLQFSRSVAALFERRDPARYTTAFAKRGREAKILIDYLRNNRTNTSIAAFSTRARARAPVSWPVGWDELGPRLDPARITVATVPRRLARRKSDPWRDYWRSRQRLTMAMVKAVRDWPE